MTQHVNKGEDTIQGLPQVDLLEGFAVGIAGHIGPDGEVVFDGASFMPAPRCQKCGKGLTPLNSLEWVCGTSYCTDKGLAQQIARQFGVYPLRKAD